MPLKSINQSIYRKKNNCMDISSDKDEVNMAKKEKPREIN